MKTLTCSSLSVIVFLIVFQYGGRIAATEVDFVAAPENTDDDMNVDVDDEPNFSFDDSTFYKLHWANYVPAVSSASSSKDKSKDKGKDKSEDKDFDTEVKVYDRSDKERKHENFEEMIMTSPNNEKYRCLIPIVKPKDKTPEDEDKGLSRNPYTVLKELFSHKYCSYRVETFWTYEICHGYYIRQYHEDVRNKDNNQEYFLGKFDPSDVEKYEKEYETSVRGKTLPTVNVFDFTMPYVSVNMTDGTLCDLSQTKRTAKVKYVCVEESLHDLYSIKETSTCEYEVISFSSSLCDVPEFKMKTSRENDIRCYPLDDSPPVPFGFDFINKTSD